MLAIPGSAHELAPHYDLTISHPAIDMAQYAVFGRWLAEAARPLGLSCALIHQGVVAEALRRLATGELTIGFHLDYESYWHRADDPFARLAFAVLDAGGHPVNVPARSRAFTDKASAHHELVRARLGVPPTVLVRPWTPPRDLTEQERWELRLDEPGTRVFLKPANGSCGRGVARVDRPTPQRLREALAEVRRFDPDDTYLVQTEVRPPRLTCADAVSRPAYWRVLSCLGEVTAFWWQPHEHLPAGVGSYRAVTREEVRRNRLEPIYHFTQTLGELTGLEWFSTELALCPVSRPGRFRVEDGEGRELPLVAIDYLNDQCDVDPQSRWPGGPPDEYVRRLARRFAEKAAKVRWSGAQPLRRAA